MDNGQEIYIEGRGLTVKALFNPLHFSLEQLMAHMYHAGQPGARMRIKSDDSVLVPLFLEFCFTSSMVMCDELHGV